MADLLDLFLATTAAILWLWAWNRFAPRPSDRWIQDELHPQPSGRVAMFALVLILLTPFIVQRALSDGRPFAQLAEEEKARRLLVGSLISGPIEVVGVLLALAATKTPVAAVGIRRQGIKPSLIEGFRVWWEWLPLVMCMNASVRLLWPKVDPEQINPVEKLLLGQPPAELLWLAGVAAVVRAPIVEELMFRGVFQTWFNVGGAWIAIVFSSIVFAAVHSPAWPDPLPLVLVGVMLGSAYQRTRNLLAPIFAHMLFNGGMTALALLTRR